MECVHRGGMYLDRFSVGHRGWSPDGRESALSVPGVPGAKGGSTTQVAAAPVPGTVSYKEEDDIVPANAMHDPEDHGTFSIVACDPERQFWGVAVATKPPSVGALVPWVEWRAGALATQAMANYFYGPRGLELLKKGLDAEAVVRRLTAADTGREDRQLGVVDRRGGAASWTGGRCVAFAGHLTGDGFACQGNMLRSDTVVPAMAKAFESSRGLLAGRLLQALEAGAKEGGDKRGMSSAALLVSHREPWFPAIWPSHWVNLRVDRSPHPIRDLARLVRQDAADTRAFLAARARAAKVRPPRSRPSR